MTPRFAHTIECWEKAAQDPNPAEAIHPSGGDPGAYERSGKLAALEVLRVLASMPLDELGYSRILDYGCGDGRVLRHFADVDELGGLTYGYDTSETMRALARRNCPKAIIVDSLSLVHVDVAYSHAVFIHHTYDDGARMLAELAAVVRPGGCLAVQIPLYDVPREPETWTAVGVWTAEQLAVAARDAGCTVEFLYRNPGAFSYASPGDNHYRLQVLRRAP